MSHIPTTTIHRSTRAGTYGVFALNIEINDAPEKLTDEQYEAVAKAEELIEAAFMTQRIRDNPSAMAGAASRKAELLACFPDRIFVEEIPNGYCSLWCCKHLPWLKVTTVKGVITIGWRKRVIEIEWTESVNAQEAVTLFQTEDVTKTGRTIHAWGYAKAKEYIERITAP